MVRIHEGSPRFNKRCLQQTAHKTSFILQFIVLCAVVVQLVRIPACHAGGREFESRPPRHNDLLAQLVEQFPFKEWAHGSNP